MINYTPKKTGLPFHQYPKLFETAYEPIFDLLQELSIPVVHCFSARTLEIFQNQRKQNLLDALTQWQESDLVEVAIKGYSSAFFSNLPEEDIYHQLTFAREIEKEMLGEPSTGFIPEEGWLDVLTPDVLQKFNFRWTLVSGQYFLGQHGQNVNNLSRLKKISGLNGSSIDTFCTLVETEERISQQIDHIFSDQVNAKETVSDLCRFLEACKASKPVLVLKFSAEAPFFQSSTIASLQRLRFFLQCLQSVGSFNITIPKTIQRKSQGEPEDIYMDLKKDQRLDILFKEAREAILRAKNKNPDSILLRRAWKNLLTAQEYEVDNTQHLPHSWQEFEGIPGDFYEYISACELVQAAKRNAESV